MKYLYLEGRFETYETGSTSCFMLKYHKNFFAKTRFHNLHGLTTNVCLLPYEFNLKYQNLALQVNDYMHILLFKLNSKQDYLFDSSMDRKLDTGKKITVIFVIFPKEVKISDRKIVFQTKDINGEVKETTADKPLTCLISKTRLIAIKVKSIEFEFALLYYYIHGPIDDEINI